MLKRRSRGAWAACCAAAAVAGCADPGALGTARETREFDLGGERFAIALPPLAQIAEDPGGAFIWIEVLPAEQASPSIWLEAPYDETQPFDFDRRADWRDARRLEFRVAVAEGEDGRSEHNLDGRLSLGSRIWTVSCRTSDESLEGDWCLPLLQSIRPAEP